MGSLTEGLRRREAAPRAEADRVRTRIEELAEDLARAEDQITRLAIAREEVTRVLEEPAAAVPPAGQDGAVRVPGHPQNVHSLPFALRCARCHGKARRERFSGLQPLAASRSGRLAVLT
jgi:hypothetical protein